MLLHMAGHVLDQASRLRVSALTVDGRAGPCVSLLVLEDLKLLLLLLGVGCLWLRLRQCVVKERAVGQKMSRGVVE